MIFFSLGLNGNECFSKENIGLHKFVRLKSELSFLIHAKTIGLGNFFVKPKQITVANLTTTYSED